VGEEVRLRQQPLALGVAPDRRTTSRPPKPPALIASTAAARAAGFWSGATESSRSTMIASAARVRALASALGLEAGM